MEKLFFIYIAVMVAMLTGFLYYKKKCSSMIHEYRRMKFCVTDNQKTLAFMFQDLIPNTVFNQGETIQQQRILLQHMHQNLDFALANPNTVDLIACSYANAKLLLATCLESCHQHGLNEVYMQRLYDGAGGYSIDDDSDILALYELLNRKRPVELFFFNRMTMKKEKR